MNIPTGDLNINVDLVRELLLSYGPILIVLIIVLVAGKFLLGNFNTNLASKLKDKAGYRNLEAFLAKNNAKTFSKAWKDYFAVEGNKSFFIYSFAIVVALMLASAKFLAYNADQPGMVIYDPIIPHLQPIDFSLPIFILEYICVILIVFHVADKPQNFVRAIWCVAAIFWLRSFTITLIPLSPPEGMILLKDPFVQFFFGEETVVINDLFFSGHVSLLTLFFLASESKWLKVFLGMAIFAVGLMLIWQRVHYTTDVVFAPLFTYAVFQAIYMGKMKIFFHQVKSRFSKA